MVQSNQNGASQNWYQPMNRGMSMGMGNQSQFSGDMSWQQVEPSIAQQQQQQPVEAFDEEAFARAFEEAAKESQIMERAEVGRDQDMVAESLGMEGDLTAALARYAQKQDEIISNKAFIEEAVEHFTYRPHFLDQARLGADLIHDPMSESQEQPEQEDPDALARTAGQLLNSVRSNQSNKFQNSEFLGLMRQFRDREVTVKGDGIVGTQAGTGEDNEAKVVSP